MPKREYKTSEVSEMTGASLRQLQWWDERQVLRPKAIEGHSRLYSESQIKEIRNLVKLRRAGVSLQHIRRLSRMGGWDRVKCIKRPTVIDGVLFVPQPRQDLNDCRP